MQCQNDCTATATAQKETPATSADLYALTKELFQTWWHQIAAEKAKRCRVELATQCDHLEEVERVLTARAGGLENPELLRLQEVVVVMECSRDGDVAAQELEAVEST